MLLLTIDKMHLFDKMHWHLFITNNAKVFTLRAYKDKRVIVGVCQYHYRVTKISCKDRTKSRLSLPAT